MSNHQPESAHIAALRAAIDAAHQEQRQALDAGRGEETMTLFQHWSATAGWLASRIRAIDRVGEADWPDAMNTAEAPDAGISTPPADECHHEWLDRPESDTRECLICGTEVAG